MTVAVEKEPPENTAPRADEDPASTDHLRMRSRSELAAHLETPGKQDAYRDFLRSYGVDPDAEGVRPPSGTALLMAEQPGSWLTPRDYVRARLLELLVSDLGFDRRLSGARTLSHDRFTADGEKGVFLDFCLHPELGPVRLVGSSFIKKFKHRSYASLRLRGNAVTRFATTLDYAVLMLKTARQSPARFAKVMTTVFDSSPLPGARDILPATNDPAELRRISRDLARADLLRAKRSLVTIRRMMRQGVYWSSYWDAANGIVLSLRSRDLSPLLGRMLLAVEDPIRMSRSLLEDGGAQADGMVSVAGLVSPDGVFRTVLFDPENERFFSQMRGGKQCDIEWDELRQAAAKGQGARPSGVLEYLLMAAFGYYMLVDSGDSFLRFHERVCRIHRARTGVGYPWLTCAAEGPLTDENNNHFTHLYRPVFKDQLRDQLDSFMLG